ncbi:MAG: LuxR C-terminal-related transcriptional regulator [Nocardiopsaceae bacterium]|jgi:HD-GYP domain-containing protein (c-di-GMP phosphodiesterase class II)|nr:LuxR C-terminal-related transcriptional regulator [Nocardiopsaceae bacterium]
MSSHAPSLRLVEAVGVMSLATDLAMGQPLEHGLRTAIMALRIAQSMRLDEVDQATVFYTGVLHFAGCTAESEVDAQFFGDELAARPQMLATMMGSRRQLIATAMRVAHAESAPMSRAARMARSAFGGIAEFRKWAASHCDVARVLGARMGFSDDIQTALRHLYERWDGKGMPGDLRGTEIPLAVRLMQVAQDADIICQHGGRELAGRVLRERAGSGLDPDAVAACLDLGDGLYAGLDAPSIWELALEIEPGPRPVVGETRLDACLSAMADFADLKSMWTVGHSRGVARLVAGAAAVAGLPGPDIGVLRRAGFVHDIGRVAVPVHVWASPNPLTRAQREQVRLHAYHSERVLGVSASLRLLARLAGAHGERYDGSGYHRGSKARDLPLGAWLLAAADCYHAMRESRGHRPRLSAAAAADELRKEVAAGRLGGDAVNAVLVAAGQPNEPVPRPAGLSERECAVLGLLARGLATKQVARQLGISPKTCDHHIQSVYGKVGVSTRAGATLFALEHGLVSSDLNSPAGGDPGSW